MEITDEAIPYTAHRDPAHLERVRVLVNPSACERGAFHASINNSQYCRFEARMKRQQAAWQLKENTDTAHWLEISPYQHNDGEAVRS
jgi:hypothetical protein